MPYEIKPFSVVLWAFFGVAAVGAATFGVYALATPYWLFGAVNLGCGVALAVLFVLIPTREVNAYHAA